ncbi:MAG: hypothetical protein WCW93_00710 [Candidatus Paceibacterota bacterium]
MRNDIEKPMVKENSLNNIHPELQPGEKFFTNANKDNVEIFRSQGKRIGDIAYGPDGKILEGYFPVFTIESTLN